MFCYRSDLLLFNFQNATDLSDWSEISDTVRAAGRSKATFDLYKAEDIQNAIFFSLLNPLPNGACFCGFRKMTQLNLDGYKYLHFECISMGNATTYKIVLRHNNLHTEPNPAFEQHFRVDNYFFFFLILWFLNNDRNFIYTIDNRLKLM